MSVSQAMECYLLRLGDTSLVTAQRLCEWVGHAPEIEEDIGLANLGLDLLGQSRLLYAYAAELQGSGATEDTLAFSRADNQFRNLLLAEQPIGDFGFTIVRQFLLAQWQLLLYEALCSSADRRLSEIGALAVRELRYHVRFTAGWLVRLGDGTNESHARVQRALDELWRFTAELFEDDAIERDLHAQGAVPLNASLRAAWDAAVTNTLSLATLRRPGGFDGLTGGRSGRHTEHLSFLLAEMQSVSRAHPGAVW